MPPYSREIRLIFISSEDILAEKTANQYYKFIHKKLSSKKNIKFYCLLPKSAVISKIRRKYYWNLYLYLCDKSIYFTKNLIHYAMNTYKDNKVLVQVDIDPN